MTVSCLLAIETATEHVGVALASGPDFVLREARDMRAPSRLIYRWIAEVLTEAARTMDDLDGIIFGAGPGSFTGVRVATAAAQAVGFARNIPVLPVSTLAAMAWPVLKEAQAPVVMAALDARMGELYVGTYRLNAHGDIEAVHPDRLAGPDSPLALPDQPFAAIGPGFAVYPDLLAKTDRRPVAVDVTRLPDVRSVLAVGQRRWPAAAVVAEEAIPNYVRSRVTRT